MIIWISESAMQTDNDVVRARTPHQTAKATVLPQQDIAMNERASEKT